MAKKRRIAQNSRVAVIIFSSNVVLHLKHIIFFAASELQLSISLRFVAMLRSGPFPAGVVHGDSHPEDDEFGRDQ